MVEEVETMTEESEEISFRMRLVQALTEEGYLSGTPDFDAEFERRLLDAGFKPTKRTTGELFEAAQGSADEKRTRREAAEASYRREKAANWTLTIILLVTLGIIVLMVFGIFAT